MTLCLIMHDFTLLKICETVTSVQMRKSQEVSQHFYSYFLMRSVLKNMIPPVMKGLSLYRGTTLAINEIAMNIL